MPELDPSAASVRDRVRERLSGHRHLVAGSAALVTGAAVQAVTGAVFWLVAARMDSTGDVGRATALFTSTLFVAYLAGLGLQVSLARFSPDRSEASHATFSWAVLANATSATLVAGGYLLVVDTDASRALTDWHPIGGPALFLLAAVGASLTLIVDVRWMTVRRWSLVLGRIVLVGVGRFPLLLVPDGGRETVHLFAVATLPLAISGLFGVAAMPRWSGGRHRLRPRPPESRAFVRYSAVNWLSTLAYQAPQFVLPVIVLLSVDPDRNAAFYVAWGITGIVLYVPAAIGQALLAEGGKDGAVLRNQVRVAVVATVGLMLLAFAATAIGRDLVTLVYGEDYRDGARVLPTLVAAAVPWAVTSVYLTEARVLHRHRDTVAISLVLTTAILLPALVLVPDDGIDGAGQAFLAGNAVAAAVAVVTHRLLHRRVPRVVPDPEPLQEDLALHP